MESLVPRSDSVHLGKSTECYLTHTHSKVGRYQMQNFIYLIDILVTNLRFLKFSKKTGPLCWREGISLLFCESSAFVHLSRTIFHNFFFRTFLLFCVIIKKKHTFINVHTKKIYTENPSSSSAQPFHSSLPVKPALDQCAPWLWLIHASAGPKHPTITLWCEFFFAQMVCRQAQQVSTSFLAVISDINQSQQRLSVRVSEGFVSQC